MRTGAQVKRLSTREDIDVLTPSAAHIDKARRMRQSNQIVGGSVRGDLKKDGLAPTAAENDHHHQQGRQRKQNVDGVHHRPAGCLTAPHAIQTDVRAAASRRFGIARQTHNPQTVCLASHHYRSRPNRPTPRQHTQVRLQLLR